MLAGLKEVIAEARKNGRAVGSFNTPNFECLEATLSAAEKLNVPVIIAHAQCHEDVAPLGNIGRAMIALAEAARVKVCVHLDHGEDAEYCRRALGLGFTSVMIDGSALPLAENVALTREVAEDAHARGADVEAELGRLPAREGGASGSPKEERPEDLYTDPSLVCGFLEETGADALAIAFGTAHGIYKVKPVLDFNVISRVRALTDVPLVMHGGSGISPAEYREAISRGIDKINYYTYMSYAGYAAAAGYLREKDADFYHNLAAKARAAMEENVLRTLKVFSGMA